MSKEYEKYYPKMDGQTCLEVCKVVESNKLGIASFDCLNGCTNNEGGGKDEKGYWIKCSKLKEATGGKDVS